jgi:TolB-like protein/Tfp pilus assembly protein PilF
VSFFSELRRRSVFKVGVAYAVMAWLLIQVVAVVLPIFDAPRWIVQTLTLIIILGFPVALFLAWAYELTPGGIKPTSQVEQSGGVSHATSHKLNYAIIGALLLAIGFLVVDNYVLDESAENGSSMQANAGAPSPDSGGDSLAQIDVLPNSVAVLPFENLSLDPQNAFFATGFHDELLNQLAKIRDLNVIARTSVLRYAGSSKSIPEIAAELKVGTVMEGSVQYAGGDVRVTTQLIDAATSAHLWSETYTRPFENIFEIETEIAMQIATALEAEFSLSEQQSIASQTGSRSAEALAIYVRAIERWQEGIPTPDRFARVENDLNRVIDLDPSFVQPYAILADIYAERLFTDLGTPENWQSQRNAISARAEEFARTAIRLDPSYGYPHAVLGKIHEQHWRDEAAREEYERGWQLGSTDAETSIEYAWFCAKSGRFEDAVNAAERAIALDPNNSDIRSRAGTTFAMTGDLDRAIAIQREAIALDPSSDFPSLLAGMFLAARGDVAEAIEYVRTGDEILGAVENAWALGELAYAYGLAQDQDEARRTFDRLVALSADHRVGPVSWTWAYLGIGDDARALEMLNLVATERTPDEAGIFRGLFKRNFAGDPVLERPEFVEVRGRLGYDE